MNGVDKSDDKRKHQGTVDFSLNRFYYLFVMWMFIQVALLLFILIKKQLTIYDCCHIIHVQNNC